LIRGGWGAKPKDLADPPVQLGSNQFVATVKVPQGQRKRAAKEAAAAKKKAAEEAEEEAEEADALENEVWQVTVYDLPAWKRKFAALFGGAGQHMGGLLGGGGGEQARTQSPLPPPPSGSGSKPEGTRRKLKVRFTNVNLFLSFVCLVGR